jgi:hypothetical protein
MDLVGCFGVRSITASCLGVLIRAETSGRLSRQPILAELVDRAVALLPARRAMIDNSPWPDFWCAPAFAATLQRASAESAVGVQPKVTVSAVAAAAAAHTFLRKNSLLALFAPSFGETVIGRWTKLIGIPGDLFTFPEDVFRQRMNELEAGSRYDALRNFLNAWTTFSRIQSDTQSPCRCDCTGRGVVGGDSLRHYALGCQPLCDVADVPLPFQVVTLACLRRFGLSPCDPRRAAFLGHLYRAAGAGNSPLNLDELCALEHVDLRARLALRNAA